MRQSLKRRELALLRSAVTELRRAGAGKKKRSVKRHELDPSGCRVGGLGRV